MERRSSGLSINSPADVADALRVMVHYGITKILRIRPLEMLLSNGQAPRGTQRAEAYAAVDLMRRHRVRRKSWMGIEASDSRTDSSALERFLARKGRLPSIPFAFRLVHRKQAFCGQIPL